MSYELFDTLENGTEICVEYTYSGGSADSYWEPGDPPECEIQKVTRWEESSQKWLPCPHEEFTQEQYEKWEQKIHDNPPEPDYPDYD